MLDEQVFLQITDQVGQLIDDYKKEVNEGYTNFKKKFSISFKTVLSPESEAGKTKVVTTMTFQTKPKPKVESGQVKDRMEVIVGGKQLDLPTK